MKIKDQNKIETQLFDYDNKIGMSFFLQLLKPFKVHIATLLGTGVIWSIFTVVKAYALKVIIDSLIQDGLNSIAWPLFIYFFSWLMTELFQRVRDYAVMYLKPYLRKNVVTQLSRRMLQYDDHYFQQNQPSALNYALRSLYDGVDDGIYIVEELFSHGILITSALVSMYIINAYFSLIAIAWFIVWGIFACFWSRNGHLLAYLIGKARTKMTFHLGDAFANTSTIKTFNASEYENEITEEISQEVALIEFQREKMFFQIWCVQGFLFFITAFLVFTVLLSGYKNGTVTIGDFAMMVELLQTIYNHLFDFAKDVSELSEVTGKVQQGARVVYKNLPNQKSITPERILKATKGEIIFDKVRYQYPDSIEKADAFASNKQITIPGGSTVALIGPSGSGKTTLTKLLLRLIDPISGKILIDGQDIAECNIESVRSAFALIPQEMGIFHRTIRENIQYGSPNATLEQIIAAAKKAKIHDIISRLPNQYDSVYGKEMGLSGGQKQRIIIARGLLRNAKIFLFDESTSALDVKTESDVIKNIQETTKNCTKIIIAHRLSTVKHVDMILVCDDGEIVEIGTHDQLMKKRGLYFSMVNLA